MSMNEMFPEKCSGGGCRNKVRVWVPDYNKVTRRVEKIPYCVKHADARQRKTLAENAELMWAFSRAPGHPDI